MFAAARYVRDHVRLDRTANAVALALVTFTRRDGSCPASIRQIAQATMLHPETVQLAIGRLESEGVVAVDRHKGRGGNVFRWPVVDVIELSTNARVRSAHYGTAADSEMRGSRARNARVRSAHLENQSEKETRALLDAGWHFVPGTGWSAPYTGAVNE